MYELKKVQITCPNCKYEFPYNKAALDNKIRLLGKEIHQLDILMQKLNKIPDEKLNKEEIKRIKKKKDEYQQQLVDLKLTRETLKESEDRNVLANLKQVIRENYGKEIHDRFLDEALRRSSAYETSDLMNIGYYSHAGGKRVRKL